MSYWRGTAVLELSLLTLEQKKARRHVGRGTAVPGEVALFYSVFSAYWQRCTCLVSGVCSELLGTTESSCAIVRSVVQLAVSLGKTTPAEGVETKEHLERVRAEGCTEVQGYYISRPKPSSDIAALLLTHAEKSANAA
jgi:hypothetical protein